MDIFWIIFCLMIGSCVGSFLNVVIYRLPRGESIAFPPSHCPQCGRGIKWHDNIPILSWIVLKAKCRFCNEPISPRYILVEATTAILVAGLYVCYFVLRLRDGAGDFVDSWPMFLAHAALVCSLLVCSLVDIERWIVPLEVCWFVSLVGIVSSTAAPHEWIGPVSPTAGAAGIGGAIGLLLGLVCLHYGLIQRSFIDADDKEFAGPADGDQPKSVAATSDDRVNVRIEVLRELIFLGPAIIMAVVAAMLVTKVPAIGDLWQKLTHEGPLAKHVNGFTAALFGYLIGGLWIWGIRILGTLGFGKEAMGLGDVHIMAAVGAVAGWVIPSIAFFVAPIFGLLWAVYLWFGRNQRELPYGPWLAVGSLAVMLFYDVFAKFLEPYRDLFIN